MKHILLLSIILLFASCKKETSNSTKNVDSEASKIEPKPNYVNPPLKGVNIPYTTHKLTTTKDQTIVLESGTSIKIPKDAFVDKNGNAIIGETTIKCREFKDPLDFFISGIPMTMTFNNTEYQLESENMFEIQGEQNGSPVFINPKSPLEVNFNTVKTPFDYKIIELDTINKNWSVNASPETTNITFQRSIEQNVPKPIKFVKPRKANTS